MKTYKTIEEVADALNAKYSSIKDFKVFASSDNKIEGGFYWMNYMFNEYKGNHFADYPFHEVFGAFDRFDGSLDEFFDYLDQRIQSQLKWQKEVDEMYAAEFAQPVNYKFNYSLIQA